MNLFFPTIPISEVQWSLPWITRCPYLLRFQASFVDGSNLWTDAAPVIDCRSSWKPAPATWQLLHSLSAFLSWLGNWLILNCDIIDAKKKCCLFFYEITFRNFPRIGHVDLGVEKTFTFPGLLLPTFLRQSHHPFRFSLGHASLGVCRLCGLISMRLPPNGKFLVKCCSLPDSRKKK